MKVKIQIHIDTEVEISSENHLIDEIERLQDTAVGLLAPYITYDTAGHATDLKRWEQ